jgi:hypothetical protein
MNADEHGSFPVQATLHAESPKLAGVLLNKTLLALEELGSSFGRRGDPCSSVFGYPRRRVCRGSLGRRVP